MATVGELASEGRMAHADKVMSNNDPGRVWNLVDRKSGHNLKLDILTGTLVIFRSSDHNYITAYQICRGKPTTEAYIIKATEKIEGGQWGTLN